MLIELFGHPGAGKSTLARAALADSDRRATASLGAAWKKQSSLAKGLLVGRAILDGACLGSAMRLATSGRLFRGDSLPRLVRLVIKSHWIRSQKEPLLLEEGHLQELWSVLYSAGRLDPDPQLLAPLIRCLYRGVDAQLVFLDVDPESAFQRIRTRKHGKSRLDRLAEAELRNQLVARAQLPHQLVEAARLAGLRVERLDAALPIEATVDQLHALMRTIDRSSGRRG